MTTHSRPALAQVLLAFAGIYIIWGTTFLAIALVIRTIPPFFSGALRFFLPAASCTSGCARARRIRSRACTSGAPSCAAC
jgi:drug/metabolite transporter (DMT)-like permease